jgi:hypothetical protein
MNDDFVKIDLHIHTPESKCYKGKKDDSEFLDILRKARKEKLKIIAITDHNSIQGYKKLVKLKSSLCNEIKTLSSITDSEQSKVRSKELEQDLQLFEDILILAGIEFEVRNGIHLLIIFGIDTPVEVIDKFIIDGGYRPQNFGEENPSTLANWDIFALLDESKKYNCLIIDAHTDSNKGILNTIPKGAQRAACFRSPQLNAVCYKNEEQMEKLKQILQSAKEYARQVPLSFVKFSDAHSVSAIGSVFTWVRLDNINLESLRSAFANPSELVSIEQPSLARILNEVLIQDNSFGIPDLSPDSKELFKRYICSLHNSSGGNILFGVNEKKKICGLIEKTDQISTEIIECFEDIDGDFRYKIMGYPLQNKRIVVSIRVPQGTSLINIINDGLIYSIKNKSINILSAEEVQTLVEDRLMDDMGSRISKRLLAVEKDCHLIKNLFSTMPIIRSFEKNSIEAEFDIEVEKSIELDVADIQKLKNSFSNGTSRGNIFFLSELQPPRLKYTYLRYSLPIFMLRSIKRKAVVRDTIYITPGGSVYFCKKDCPMFSDIEMPVLKLYKTLNTRYGIRFITCFLKSSFLLWYCKNKFDDIDLHNPNIFKNLRLPILDISDQSIKGQIVKINGYFDQIIGLERNYLAIAQKLKKPELQEHTDKHNMQVDKIAYDIDHIIYQLLNLTTDEISVIEDNLRLNEVYLPKTV